MVAINPNAPAVARAEALIQAPPETVWQVIADIAGWPRWNPDVKSALVDGPLAEGTAFRWKAGPGSITSVLGRVEPSRLIAWTGRTMGIRAVHVWTFESHSGGTLAKTEESWDGWAVRLLAGPMRSALRRSLEAGLGYLKVEAERRAAV